MIMRFDDTGNPQGKYAIGGRKRTTEHVDDGIGSPKSPHMVADDWFVPAYIISKP